MERDKQHIKSLLANNFYTNKLIHSCNKSSYSKTVKQSFKVTVCLQATDQPR